MKTYRTEVVTSNEPKGKAIINLLKSIYYYKELWYNNQGYNKIWVYGTCKEIKKSIKGIKKPKYMRISHVDIIDINLE